MLLNEGLKFLRGGGQDKPVIALDMRQLPGMLFQIFLQPIPVNERQFERRLSLENVKQQVARDERSGNRVSLVCGQMYFTRREVQESFITELEQIRHELAFLALPFG